MSFVEINVFGVLISPFMPMMVIAFAITMVLRWIAVELGWVRGIWHPALFEFSAFILIFNGHGADVRNPSDLQLGRPRMSETASSPSGAPPQVKAGAEPAASEFHPSHRPPVRRQFPPMTAGRSGAASDYCRCS